VEAAIASKNSARRVDIGAMLELALAQAADAEQHDDVRRQLQSWDSASTALVNAASTAKVAPAV
jgi:hypothetical protein